MEPSFDAESLTGNFLQALIAKVFREVDNRHLKKVQPIYMAEWCEMFCDSVVSQAGFMYVESIEHLANTFSDNYPDEPIRLMNDNWVRNRMPINRGKSKKLRKVSGDELEMRPVKPNQIRKSERSMYEGRSFSDFESIPKKQGSELLSDIFDREKPLTDNTNFFSTREGFKLVTYDERVKPVPVDIADHSDDDELAKVQNSMRTRKDNKMESEH